jgi:hypothetical protein
MEQDLRERSDFALACYLNPTFGSREFILEELAQEINEKQEDLDIREKNLIRREEILEQRMGSQDFPEATPFPAQIDKSENPRDEQNWWSYVWHAKREVTPQTGIEEANRNDVLEAQGVEIVTLRQVFKLEFLFLIVLLGGRLASWTL